MYARLHACRIPAQKQGGWDRGALPRPMLQEHLRCGCNNGQGTGGEVYPDPHICIYSNIPSPFWLSGSEQLIHVLVGVFLSCIMVENQLLPPAAAMPGIAAFGAPSAPTQPATVVPGGSRGMGIDPTTVSIAVAPSVLLHTAAIAMNLAEDRLAAYVSELGGEYQRLTLGELFACREQDLIAAIDSTMVNGAFLPSLAKGALIRELTLLAEMAGVHAPDFGVPQPLAAPPQDTAVAPVQTTTMVPAGNPSTGLAYKRYLGGEDTREFVLLPSDRVRQLNSAYRQRQRRPPPEYEEVTLEQLSAVAGRLAEDLNPAADFSVFGPFGRRLQRYLSTRAQIWVDGQLVTRTLTGPQNFEAWRKCWRVWRTALDKLLAAETGPVDDYEEGIRQLSAAHPLDWGTIVVADDHMRHERFPRLREEIERRVASGTFTGEFDPQKPWEAVIAHAAYGSGEDDRWWFRQVEKPCMSGPPGDAASTAAAIEGSRGIRYLDEDREQNEYQVTPQASRRTDPPSVPGFARGQRRGDRREIAAAQGRRPDGRHLVNGLGKELCFAWNRNTHGCADKCVSQPAREHACEWCLGTDHRAVDDSYPARHRPRGWRPDPKGHGRGGGGSGDKKFARGAKRKRF